MKVVGFGGGCWYLTCPLDYGDLSGMTLVKDVEGDEGIEASQHPPLGKSRRPVQGYQGLLIEDSSGGKKTMAHMSGSRVMGQGQGKSNPERPAQSAPLIIHHPPAHSHVRLVREADGPDPAMASHLGCVVGCLSRVWNRGITWSDSRSTCTTLAVLCKLDCRETGGGRVGFAWILWQQQGLRWTITLAVIATLGPNNARRYN